MRFSACSKSWSSLRSLQLLTVLLSCFLPISLPAQSVSFAGPGPSVNFGTVNLCPSGHTMPAPCSEIVSLVYHVTGSGELGTPKVVTLGAPNLDFTLGSGSTCTGSVSADSTCTVKIQFAPLYAGIRQGAVKIVDDNGNLLATTLIYGVGAGPQIGFSPGTKIQYPFRGLSAAHGAVMDGEGNIFVGNLLGNNVLELEASSGTTVTLPFPYLQHPWGVALDGAGDVFVADQGGDRVVELPAGADEQLVLPFTGLNLASGVAVDGAGDVFASDTDGNRVVKLPAGGGAQVTLPFTGLYNPLGLWVDNQNNILVAASDTPNNNGSNDAVAKLPVGGGSQVMLPFTGLDGVQFPAVDVPGTVYTTSYDTAQLVALPGGNPPQTVVTGVTNPMGVAVDSAGDLLIFTSDPFGNGYVGALQRSQPPALAFAQVAPGGTATLPLTIINTGSGTLTFTPSFSNPNFTMVAPEQSSCVSGISGVQSCTLQIQFSPLAPGSYNGTLTLQTNGVRNAVVNLEGSVTGSTTGIDFSGGFADAGTVQFNGNTTINGSDLELTGGVPNQSGSAFYATPVNVQSFTTDFTFEEQSAVADGFTFTIQNAGPTAKGGKGAGLGFVTIQHSVAIKFDLYDNDGEGDNSTGLYLDGNLPTVPAVDLTGSAINLHRTDPIQAHVTYDSVNLTMTLTDTVSKASWSHSWAVDIPKTVGGSTAYVGFTGSTGGGTATQTISSWKYVAGTPAPNYPAGFEAAGLSLNGSSALAGSALLLTNGGLEQAGSAFYLTPQPVGTFTTDFTFNVQDPVADGFTFAIQNVSPAQLGGKGAGLGFVTIQHSVAIKFDLYNNAGEGANSTGLYLDGNIPTLPSVDLTGSGIDLHRGDPIEAHVTYDGTTLTMRLTDTVMLANWSHSWTVNIPKTVNSSSAYVGFTGATGGGTSLQRITSWTYLPGVVVP